MSEQLNDSVIDAVPVEFLHMWQAGALYHKLYNLSDALDMNLSQAVVNIIYASR